ncbi:MAG TPA: hypothetical protein VM369_12070 [Candidatus Binatia bacterium]|nr:hypothetical protein [Candidatus Binatia bacterium]
MAAVCLRACCDRLDTRRAGNRTGLRAAAVCLGLVLAATSPRAAQALDAFASAEAAALVPDDTLARDGDTALAAGTGFAGTGAALGIDYGANRFDARRTAGSITQRWLRLSWSRDFLARGAWTGVAGIGLGAMEESSRLGRDTLPLAALWLGVGWNATRHFRLEALLRGRGSHGHDARLGSADAVDGEAALRVRFAVALPRAVPVREVPAITAAPLPPADPPPPADSDDDSVPDSLDLCPSTAPRVPVDADGCLTGASP